MNISFEIVPRDEAALKEQLAFIEANLPFVDTINVPDLLRLPIRSWDAVDFIQRDKYDFIPHVRVIDFELSGSRLSDIIAEKSLDKVLLVSGDPPPDMSHHIFDTNVLDMIAKVRADFPGITIYAGFDPYRSSPKSERNYILEKLDAGVDCLLSQPFFDIRYLQVYSDFIPAEKVFWGVSPVVTEKSRSYWEKMNHVVFPRDYEPTYEWNTAFALKVLEHCKMHGGNIYFMPIRIDLKKYFLPISEAW